MANEKWPVYGEISGPVVMIGFGSIGRGALPLIERHFTFDRKRAVVIDPRAVDLGPGVQVVAREEPRADQETPERTGHCVPSSATRWRTA